MTAPIGRLDAEILTSGGDAQVIADLAVDGATAEPLDRGDLVNIGGKVVDLTDYADTPRQVRGRVTLHDAPSLVRYVQAHQHADRPAEVYVDRCAASFVAILDPSGLAPTGDVAPSWQRHRAEVALSASPEWLHWAGRDGKLMPQATFADHVESHLADVVEPAGAVLLEVAQSIEGTTKVEWVRAERLDNGQRRFTYRETVEGKAGGQGQLDIPATFTLGIPVFEGDTEGYRLTARLRWRIEGDGLALGYALDRPDVVWRDAVDRQVEIVEKALDLTAYRGVPLR